jgi:8-oxo-dGTP diphosphatase
MSSVRFEINAPLPFSKEVAVSAASPRKLFRYCPKCGARYGRTPLSDGQNLGCKSCGFVHFHNPSTAVGAIAENARGELLLIQRRTPPNVGAWGLPGGFLDWGENPEAALSREVLEETGARFTALTAVGAYHNWYPFQGLRASTVTVVLAGRCRGRVRPTPEASACRWFPTYALPRTYAFAWIPDAIRRYLRMRKS